MSFTVPVAGKVNADGQNNADKTTSDGKGFVEVAQSLLGFLVAGFAAVLSFIGIKSSELSSILRNEEPLVGIVALAFLLSIITAILSIFQNDHVNNGWPTNRFAVASLVFLFALVTLLPAVIRIPFVTSAPQVTASIICGALVATASLIVAFYKGAPATYFSGEKTLWILENVDGARRNAEVGEAIYGNTHSRHEELRSSWTSWGDRHFDAQKYFVLASVLFLAIAAYGALRLESASQSSPFSQLDGSVTVASNRSALLSLSVASAKVPAPDRVDVTVTGLPRTVKIPVLCKGIKTPLYSFSCAADPCSYKPLACDSLVGWTVPPNAAGAVQETLSLPFSPSAYQRLHIEDQMCQRASAATHCANSPPGGTHLDVEVPAP